MIRRATLEDLPVLIEQIGVFLKESPFYRDIKYEPKKMEALIRSGLTRKSFFCEVAIDNDEIIGGLCADTFEYTFSHEAYAADLLMYIKESKRSLRLATALVARYIEWGKDRRLREVRLASTTGIKTEKFGLLCERIGFKPLGSIYSMEI